MTDTILTLGGVAFEKMEVPEEIEGLGGEQALVVHRMIGGKRVVDAMGADEDDISWDGIFRGSQALQRAQAIDRMRRAGLPVEVSFGELVYTVVIQRFQFRYQRFYEIPYRILLVVKSNDNDPAPTGAQVGIDEMVASDATLGGGLASAIADPILSRDVSRMTSAISGVQDFTQATASVLQDVMAPIAAVQTRVGELISSTDAILGSVSAVGGIIPGLSYDELTGNLTSQIAAMTRSAELYDLQSVVGRMATNIQSIGTGGADYVVAGGDLMSLAARVYGDATMWTTIARANGLLDPVIDGVKSLTVPPTPRIDGGVLEP